MCTDSVGDSQTLLQGCNLFYFEEFLAFICSHLFIIMNSMQKFSRHLQLTLFKIKIWPDFSPAPWWKIYHFLPSVAYDFCYCIHSRHSHFKSTFLSLFLLYSTQSTIKPASAFLHPLYGILIHSSPFLLLPLWSRTTRTLPVKLLISLFEPVTLQSVFTQAASLWKSALDYVTLKTFRELHLLG